MLFSSTMAKRFESMRLSLMSHGCHRWNKHRNCRPKNDGRDDCFDKDGASTNDTVLGVLMIVASWFSLKTPGLAQHPKSIRSPKSGHANQIRQGHSTASTMVKKNATQTNRTITPRPQNNHRPKYLRNPSHPPLSFSVNRIREVPKSPIKVPEFESTIAEMPLHLSGRARPTTLRKWHLPHRKHDDATR